MKKEVRKLRNYEESLMTFYTVCLNTNPEW